jgi:hypothetical protein
MTQPELRIFPVEEGDRRVELISDGASISRCTIVPFTLRIGAARVRMDGIAAVGTDPAYRMQGHAATVMCAAVEDMRRRDAALSMLYGIMNFYPRFGYATAGPDHLLFLGGLGPEVHLPPGWAVRELAEGDLPVVKALYDLQAAGDVGAALRTEQSRSWQRLSALPGTQPADDGCRVIVRPDGRVAGYAWWAGWHWYARQMQQRDPEAFIVAEAFAEDFAAADALLDACRLWAQERSRQREAPIRRVCIPAPPGSRLVAAATRQWAEVILRYQPCGQSMARVLDVRRLFQALEPELTARARANGRVRQTLLRFETDLGAATLRLDGSGGVVLASSDDAAADALRVQLPQSELARLAIGALAPADVLERLEHRPEARAIELLQILFPHRHPHMYLPDRF